MAAGAGYLDPQGVWRYGEDDVETLASDMLNLGQASVSAQLALDRIRLVDLEDATGGWETYAATLSGITLGTGGSATFRFRKQGTAVEVDYQIILGTGFVITAQPQFTLPHNLAADYRAFQMLPGSGGIWNNASAGTLGLSFVLRGGLGNVLIYAMKVDTAYASFAAVSATIPVTLTAGGSLNGQFSYRSAA